MTFTVKHRESEELGGGEFLYTAKTIEVVYPGPMRPGAVAMVRISQTTEQIAGMAGSPPRDPAKTEKDRHLLENEAALALAHPDWLIVAKSDEFNKWARSQSEATRETIRANGDAIVDSLAAATILTAFKRQAGWAPGSLSPEYQPVDHSKAAAGTNYFEAGIFLDREPAPDPMLGTTRFSKHIILFGGNETPSAELRRGGKVWVMNEAGGTVATYDL